MSEKAKFDGIFLSFHLPPLRNNPSNYFVRSTSLSTYFAKTIAVALYTICAILENGAYAKRKNTTTRCM
jgi:hypothetical protein